MPIFHMQINAKHRDHSGREIEIHPAVALHSRGPCLQATVTIEQNAGKGLAAKGHPQPPTRSGWCLIDTGATSTCIDNAAALEMGLPVIDVAAMSSATHTNHQCNIYPVQLGLGPISFSSPRTMGANLAEMGLIALIGRDLLASCNLFYNGPAGQFTLSL